MSGVMGAGMDGSEGPRSGAPDGRPEGGREVRWSARGKEEVVLRLLRGEGLDALARETGQPAGRISAWREEFLAAGREGLKSRPRPEQDRRLVEAQRKVGELSMALDILRGLDEEMDRRPRRPRRRTSQDGWSFRWPGSAGSRGCPGRRRASSAADAALRSPVLLSAGGRARSARCPTTSCCTRSAARSTSRRSSARATRRSRPARVSAASARRLSASFVSRAARGYWPRRRRCASAPGACTTARSPSMCPTRCGPPTPPRASASPTGAARSSRSSTTPPAKRGWTPHRGWTAGPPPTCSARSAASASARSSRPSPPGWRCATTAARAFRGHHYQAEIEHLGIARSPAYHYEPETNGCVERLLGIVKEQILWIERFATFEDLRAAVRGFGRTFNERWPLERHHYRTPAQAREHLLRQAAMT